MTLATIGLRNLTRRPARTAFSIAGVAVAVAAFIVLVGLSRGLERSWIDGLREQGTDMLGVQPRTIDILTATLDAGLTRRLEAISGVAAAAGELVDLAELDTGDVVLVTGWEEGSYLWRTQPVLQGRLPGPGGPGEAAIGQPIADALQKTVGDDLELGGRTFRITGIFGTPSGASSRFIIVPLAPLQALLGKPGKVTVFAIALSHPEDPAAVASAQARLSKAFPTLTFSATDKVADENQMLSMLRNLAWGTSTIALVLAIVLIVNTLLMSVMERTAEIGVLSAVGWPDGRIVALLIIEGLALSATGSLLGAGLGLGALEWLTRLRRVAGLLKIQVSGTTFIEIAAVTLLLSAVGCGYPAWRAARMTTVDALRAE